MSDDSEFPIFGSTSGQAPERRSAAPLLTGTLVVVLILAGFVFFSRKTPAAPVVVGAPTQLDPYASSLSISDIKMSTAENFAGGSVTYLEGKITNHGQRTLTGITAELTFKNSLGEVVQKERLPLMVITTREPYIDTANLSIAPIKAGSARDFRLTLEHISADWNQEYPGVSIVQVAGA